MYLVAGATGSLGSEICRQLGAAGVPYRALVRGSSDPSTVARLEAAGATLVQGDLKDRASLAAAGDGASTVLSTVTSMLSRQPGDSVASGDRNGQITSSMPPNRRV